MNPKIFREYDIRGVVGEDLDEETVQTLGKAIGSYVNTNKLVLGRDNRLSSKPFRDAVVKGITSAGVDVVDIGMVPTPVLYFALRKLNISAGVMITGSHNPPQFNGFKVAIDMHCIFGKEIQKLREIIDNKIFKFGHGKVEEKEMVQDYIEEVVERIQLDRALKVVVDSGNGATGPVAVPLLKKLGCNVLELFSDPDGNFPNHHPDPTKPEEYNVLMETVRKERANLGVAFDGDGDRLGAVDENGKMIYGDQMMVLFSREILARKPESKICIEVKCSQGLIEDVENHGGVPVLCATGHSLIEAKLEEEKALLAGEMSGHIYFVDEWYGFDDAIYSASRLLRILSRTEKSLSALLASAPNYFSTPEIRVDCEDDKKFYVVKRLIEDFKKDHKVIDIDGARVLFENGWGLIRASNTQPALVIRAEAKSEAELEKIKGVLKERLARYDVELPV